MRLKQPVRSRETVACVALVLLLGTSASARGPIGGRDADMQLAVSQAHERYAGKSAGKVADDVPVLAAASPRLFAVVLVRVDGRIFEAGDAQATLPLTGIGAPFNAALVAEQRDEEAPTGPLTADAGDRSSANAPKSAFAPEGAMATLGLMLPESDAQGKWNALLTNLSTFAGRSLAMDDAAYQSAQSASERMQEIARRLVEGGQASGDPKALSDLFLKQASITVTTRDLAMMAATLANDGRNVVTGHRAVRAPVAQDVTQLIALSGVRGDKDSALNKTGLVATASRSGAIVVVVPGRMGIAVYSPPLDSAGISVRGQQALRYLAKVLVLDTGPVGAP